MPPPQKACFPVNQNTSGHGTEVLTSCRGCRRLGAALMSILILVLFPSPATSTTCEALLNLTAPMNRKADVVIYGDGRRRRMKCVADRINNNLNAFADMMRDAGVDLRVVLVSDTCDGREHVTYEGAPWEVSPCYCVPPPLGQQPSSSIQYNRPWAKKMVGRPAGQDCCVLPELGGSHVLMTGAPQLPLRLGGCPDTAIWPIYDRRTTSNPPKFLHIKLTYDDIGRGRWSIYQHKTALSYLINNRDNHEIKNGDRKHDFGPDLQGSTTEGYHTVLRPDALLSFIVASDYDAYLFGNGYRAPPDEHIFSKWFSDAVQAEFGAQIRPSPSLPLGFLFHSIASYERSMLGPYLPRRPSLSSAPEKCVMKCSGHSERIKQPSGVYTGHTDIWGYNYLDLSIRTGGTINQFCGDDWGPFFADIANNIAQHATPTANSTFSCTRSIFYPPDGSVVGPKAPTQILFTSRLNSSTLLASHAVGNVCQATSTLTFVVDNIATPQSATLCPAMCIMVEGLLPGVLKLRWECPSPPPPDTTSPPPPDTTSPPPPDTTGSLLPCEGEIACGCWRGVWIVIIVLLVAFVAILLIVLVLWLIENCCNRGSRTSGSQERAGSVHESTKEHND